MVVFDVGQALVRSSPSSTGSKETKHSIASRRAPISYWQEQYSDPIQNNCRFGTVPTCKL